MSKLIVEMAMPRNCFDCYFHCVGQFCDGMGYCSAVPPYCDDDCRPCEEKRPSWCPIKGVLPEEHGDLIDRDETFHAAQPQGCTDEHWSETTLGRVVLGAKTIIAAERKDDENH